MTTNRLMAKFVLSLVGTQLHTDVDTPLKALVSSAATAYQLVHHEEDKDWLKECSSNLLEKEQNLRNHTPHE